MPLVAQRDTRKMAALFVEALLDGPVTEYGLAELLGIRGGDRHARARAWLQTFNDQGLLDIVGERENPRGAAAGKHPVYALKR